MVSRRRSLRDAVWLGESYAFLSFHFLAMQLLYFIRYATAPDSYVYSSSLYEPNHFSATTTILTCCLIILYKIICYRINYKQ